LGTVSRPQRTISKNRVLVITGISEDEPWKEGYTMATSFKIVMHENSDDLHLRLAGDFDGSSASQLLEVLKDRAHTVQRVVIHTAGLGEIHPFGQGVFEKRTSELREELGKIYFTGDKAQFIAPDQSVCL
jgi:hypothetical protein